MNADPVLYAVRELDLETSDDNPDQAATVGRVGGDVVLRMTPTAAAVLARILWRSGTLVRDGHVAVDGYDGALWDDVGIDLETAQDLTAPPALKLVPVAVLGRTSHL